jgi:FO synthase
MGSLMTIDSGLLGIDTPLEDVLEEARAIRDRQSGSRITFSPKVFIPLTMLCRDRCGYCTFAKAPARVDHPYLEIDEVVALARQGAEKGCSEALFTLGERPELRYDIAQEWLRERHYDSTVAYIVAAAHAVLKETGMLPHINAGAMYREELAMLRTVSASQGMMIETLRGDLEAHRLAPDKEPSRRLHTLESAGELRIPFTTGILVGIGETRRDRLDALCAIAESAERHGHIQEVIVQNFLPKPGTLMADHPAAPIEEFLWTIAAARIILPPAVHLQAPPNLTDDAASLLSAGIDDFGGVSPVTIDHVNPERAWPELAKLRAITEGAGLTLAPRLTLYPEFVQDPETWQDEALRTPILISSDAEGLCRDAAWVSGGDVSPPNLVPSQTHGTIDSAISEVLDGVALGQELGIEEIVTLFSARGSDVVRVSEVADDLRRQINGDDVTFVINRNINYTNVCTFKCRFCAFSKGPLSLNLRGDPYLLDLEEVTRRVAEAEVEGATEVCLQGGIHPSFDGNYYLDVLGAVKAGSEKIHIHAFSALEVFEGARRSEMSLEEYLLALKQAGLKTLPGTAAEILDDEIRALLCPDKINTEQWLEVHETAHSVGLRSNVTIMFGAVEQPVSWARHIVRTREVQKRTGGFTEFVPLAFVHMATPLFIKGKARRGPTFREALLLHAVGRIAYRGTIDNVQASWVKVGTQGSAQILQAGANDLGGTLMDENISRAAGASHGQRMETEDLEAIVAPLSRPLVQRTTLYGRP